MAITSYVLRTPRFATTFWIPAYEDWIDHTDLRPAYQFHRRFLQHLQWRCQEAQWVLKSPAHLAGVDALLETYPDAGIIQTHRDPLIAMPSLANLRTVLHSAFSDQLAQHPQHRFGVHRYTLTQFGLDPTEETHRYSAYRAHFGIPSEGLSA